jgi:hypothetical protein
MPDQPGHDPEVHGSWQMSRQTWTDDDWSSAGYWPLYHVQSGRQRILDTVSCLPAGDLDCLDIMYLQQQFELDFLYYDSDLTSHDTHDDSFITYTCDCNQLGHAVTRSQQVDHHHPTCPANRAIGDNSITLRGFVNGINLDILLDSGATISFISPNSVQRMNQQSISIDKIPTINVRLGDDSAVIVDKALRASLCLWHVVAT